jgi:two-component system sensor histidine kinase KdpD
VSARTSSLEGSISARAIPSLVPAYRSFAISRAASHLLNRFTATAASALPGSLALSGVAVTTWVAFRFDQSFAFTGFLDLVVVVLAALYGGFGQATLVSVAAAACLNYFFVPPVFSFANSPANWVALGAFEFTALVISRLSMRARLRALEAIGERRDMERLYEASRRILLQDGVSEPGNPIASLIRQTFELHGVRLFDAHSGATYQSGEDTPGAERMTRDAYLLDRDLYDPETRSWYCVLRLGASPVGGLALHGTAMTRLAATALASLCAIAVERVRALQRECRAQAFRQTEQLRTAVLDALAHQFKTPIAIARTASSGLLEVGGLSELQTELVTTVDQQARKLDEVASRLLSAAMLDDTEFKPQREAVLFSRIVRAAIQRLTEATDRDRFRLPVMTGEGSRLRGSRINPDCDEPACRQRTQVLRSRIACRHRIRRGRASRGSVGSQQGCSSQTGGP